MSTHVLSGIADHPELECCVSDLRTCSKDDSDPNSIIYMFEKEGYAALDFDELMRRYCTDIRPADDTALGLARSVDALYVGKDVNAWNHTVSLVEFKNGNLYDRRHTLSNSERREFREGLINAIDAVLVNNAERMGWDTYASLEGSITRAARNFIDEHLGRAQAKRRNGGNSHHQRDSYTLETIKSKAAFSALLLQHVFDVSAEYVKQRVDMILVYNPDLNPDSGASSSITDDNTVPRVRSIEVGMPSMVARCAKRPVRRFGLAESIGPFFHDVYTCTAEELHHLLDGSF